MKQYEPGVVHAEVSAYWREKRVREKIKEKNRGGPVFSFIDGPPYTNGSIHLGHAWNKSLKDYVLRVKRMQGYAVTDRAGYDMHGLPIEGVTMKKLGLHTTKDIATLGEEAFITECQKTAVAYRKAMDAAFENLGVWMDFENAYQPIDKSFTDGVWFLIKQAHERGRLYEGLRTMECSCEHIILN